MHTGRKKAAVLFSGGRDSSLTACLLATQNIDVYLFRGSYGAPTGGDVVAVRIQELQTAFPGCIFAPPAYSITGLFRRVSIVDIESDFAKYKKNLLPLGVQLAIHAVAIIQARALDIDFVASGFTSYQSEFPEQRRESIDFFRRFMADHGIAYETPVFSALSPEEVKYGLLDYGISTKSLEGVALFGDAGSYVETETVLSFLLDKEQICRDYVSRVGAGKFK